MKNVFDFDRNMSMEQTEQKNLLWRSAKDRVFGLYGSDALHENGFCRLTAQERDIIRPVNDGEAWFGEHSAGIQARFETNSAQIFVRVALRSKFDMTNMTQIGQCGMDLYVYHEETGNFVLHEVARYAFDGVQYEVPLSHFAGAERKMRKYILYLPLYMAVDKFEIGLDADAEVSPFGFLSSMRIGIYGTSITHGCSASRPGMAYTNLLSRSMNAEVLNFGFSGVAFAEREMGGILGRRNLDMLIVDTEPNAGIDERMERNTEPFLGEFYKNGRKIPVILCSRILFALDLYDEYRVRLREYYQKFLRALAEKFRRRGYPVFFLDGSKFFKGNFTEYTTDGIHPDDAGMIAIAREYEKKIKQVFQTI